MFFMLSPISKGKLGLAMLGFPGKEKGKVANADVLGFSAQPPCCFRIFADVFWLCRLQFSTSQPRVFGTLWAAVRWHCFCLASCPARALSYP